MPIKLAAVDDIPGIIEMARSAYALTRFNTFDFDEERIIRTLREVIDKRRERYVPLVAIGANGTVVGGLLGVLDRHIFSEQLTANVMYFVVLPSARMGGYGARLLRAFETWARNRNAAEVVFGVNSGTDVSTLHRFALRMGYAHVGGIHAMKL